MRALEPVKREPTALLRGSASVVLLVLLILLSLRPANAAPPPAAETPPPETQTPPPEDAVSGAEAAPPSDAEAV